MRRGLVVAAAVVAAIALVLAAATLRSTPASAGEVVDRRGAEAGRVALAPPPAPAIRPPPRAIVDANDPLGQPLSHDRGLTVRPRAGATVGYDDRARQPAWVAYHLVGAPSQPAEIDDPLGFPPDATLRARADEVASSGADATPLAPPWLFASRGDADAAAGARIASTLAPMRGDLRLGLWRELERRLGGRGGWAERAGEVWVVAGPVHAYGETTAPVGPAVPAAFFLVVLRRDGAGWAAQAFEAPDRAEPPIPERYLVPLARVERETGLEFAPALPADARAALVDAAPSAPWPADPPQQSSAAGREGE